ncbi:hypothetical protein [Legionella sp. WA2022007384]
MGRWDDVKDRAQAYDEYHSNLRAILDEENVPAQKNQLDCAVEILTALRQHIDKQIKRYGKGEEKFNTYSNLKQDLESVSSKILLTNPNSEEREENINSVIEIMKKTGEASQQRRESFWGSVYEFIFGNKVEVKSWTNFKNTIDTVKDMIAEKNEKQREVSGPRTPDYIADLSQATDEATKEINEDSSPKRPV